MLPMKPLKNNSTPVRIPRVVLYSLCGLLLALPAVVLAQVRIINGQPVVSSGPTPPPSSSPSGGDSGKSGGPWVPSDPLNAVPLGTNQDGVELSFQGANIDMVVQWLAQTTGKTVVKHPQVQCQLN